MIWVRFPHNVIFGGVFYAVGTDIPVSDDDLAQMEARGAKIVRAVYEPEPETEQEAVVKAESPKPAASPKKRGRKPKNA